MREFLEAANDILFELIFFVLGIGLVTALVVAAVAACVKIVSVIAP
jgi:hypothetical protein